MARPRFASLLAAAALLVPAIATADVVRFSVIDAATVKVDPDNHQNRELILAGTVEGTSLTGVYLSSASQHDVQQQCLRLATLVLSKPGKYHLDVEHLAWTDRRGTLRGCTLVAAP
jgi:hypothetical protein